MLCRQKLQVSLSHASSRDLTVHHMLPSCKFKSIQVVIFEKLLGTSTPRPPECQGARVWEASAQLTEFALVGGVALLAWPCRRRGLALYRRLVLHIFDSGRHTHRRGKQRAPGVGHTGIYDVRRRREGWRDMLGARTKRKSSSRIALLLQRRVQRCPLNRAHRRGCRCGDVSSRLFFGRRDELLGIFIGRCGWRRPRVRRREVSCEVLQLSGLGAHLASSIEQPSP